jgi:2-octaprenyl-6-methoxyphenol hydroxylase
VADLVEEIDCLIVGGGLTGMALMCALAPLGYRVLLAEARIDDGATPHILETRSIALAPASIHILKQLEVWPLLVDAAAPIDTIHISEQGRFGQARLHRARDAESLGAVIEMHVLLNALKTRIDAADMLVPARVTALDSKTGCAQLQTVAGEKRVRARWVIAADGAHSSQRAFCDASAECKNYPEQALATNVRLSRSHRQIAYERFTADGPLALLPLNGPHMALVWTLPPEQAELLKTMPEPEFLKALQHAFGYRVGRFLAVGPRATYPLQQVMMPQQVYNRVAFIGNAAHTLHPVAGQGFNLGLRDVAMLAECAAKFDLTHETLLKYQRLRKSDQKIITTATDGLVSLFKNKLPGVGLLRRSGLIALDNSTLLKNIVLRYAKGFGGVVPDLVRGVSLDV